MATEHTASIHPLHQPKRPMTGAERARRYRERLRLKAAVLKPAKISSDCEPENPPPSATRHPLVKAPSPPPVTPVTPSRRHTAGLALSLAAFALAAVGVTMNGWFARSLGSSDVAGWLFFGVGVAADLAALAIPSCAARKWQGRQRGTALAAWLVWGITFAFAAMAGLGFASVNVADVTSARAARSTPAIVAAQTALTDASAARDRECKGGVGKFCREREQAVNDRRQSLDSALRTVEYNADPQTQAAIRIVTWLSAGTVKPNGDDFGLLRLILLTLLPQIGGVLLMIGRER